MNMRAGLSTIQQTLTPDAATVLNHSISEASRRNHGQTTPLHVAATLLSSPSGFLRQACIRSHPNSSHPLQCRALELCFSVALERLPTAQNNPAAEPSAPAEPPISNALMAALKRAQAHQRRGCPEQQQQPLLAVKVELEQLVISILDDPSVSRVMREARFSSPAVKAAIEQSLIATTTQSHNQIPGRNVNFGSSFSPRTLSNSGQLSTPSPTPIIQLTNRNSYLNPRLQQAAATGPIQNQRTDEVKKVLEIMGRCKKGNPILVGESEPEAVVKEFLKKIESKELESDSNFKNIQVVSMEKGLLSSDKNHISAKMEELGVAIESRIMSGGVVLDLGDLKWLVEQQQKQATVISEIGRAAVAEMTKLVGRFGGGDNNRLWLIGTATCETYLRCQVYHSTMETDWDLQAVPIASRSPLPGMFPRMGENRILSNPMESLNPMKAVQSPLLGLTRRVSENLDPSAQKSTFCPKCSENYEKEVAKLSAIHKTFSEAADKPSLPQWLQNAKLDTSDAKTTDGSEGKDHGLLPKQKTQELQKKWRDSCLHLHPNFHQNNRSDRTGPPSLSMTSLYNPNMLSRPPFQSKLQMVKPIGEALQLNTNQLVRTDLVLGREGQQDSIIASEKADGGNCNQAKDLLSCISSEPNSKFLDKFSNALDADTYKKLLKGLMEKAWWQAEAASAVASAITRCRLGNGKRRGGGSRGDVWLLFTGPDRVGKKKMASVLAEQICGGRPVIICLGRKKRDDEELLDTSFRGKTAVDRIAEAVRRNPFLVIVLEDIDEADALVRGSIRRAIERGRITDSHGREVGLGNAVFVVTGDWSTASRDDRFVDEDKLASVAGGSWQLGLIVREKMAKRRANWLVEDGPARRPRKETGPVLSLDLNLSAGFVDEDKTEGSINSSDLTVDHDGDDELDLVDRSFSITSVPHDLASSVDDSIVFKPVDSVFVRREIKKTISVKFAMVVDEDLPIEVGDDVVKKILGGLWHDRTSLEEWMENVVGPGFDQLKKRLPSVDRSKSVVRLVVESDSSDRGKSTGSEDWLPSSILV